MTNEEDAQRFSIVPNFSFNGKWERLDWKKIASLDVDKIMITSNVEVLEGLTHQIAHCKPEAEFSVEEDSPDSGLMKVFKFSQLIIQYLSFSLQRMHAQHKQILAELSQIQAANQNKTSEIQSLKDTLTQARKELRRRKELLASAQSEVLGGNKDEFDPCPYCSKKFLSSAYLLSHMHRRHQGLPINPKNPSQSLFHLLGKQDREILDSNSFLNVHSNNGPTQFSTQKDPQPPMSSSGVDYALVQEMVEKCLSEKSLDVRELRQIAGHHEGKEDRQIQTCIEDSETVETRVQDETAAAVASIMTEIKSQLEMQWKYISAKLEQARPNVGTVSEPGELGDSVLVEDHNVSGDIHKGEVHISSMQSTPVKSKDTDLQLLEVSTDAVEMELCGPHSPLQHHVNEQLQKQQEELESLRMDLEAKMDQEMNIIEGKLEAQERFWRSKLKLVKEEYDNDVERLRKEFQSQLAEIQESLAHQKPSVGLNENGHIGITSNPLYGKSEMAAISDQGLNENVSPVKTPVTEQRSENLYHSTPRGPPPRAFSFYQRASSDPQSHSVTEECNKTGLEEHPSPIVYRRGSTANSFLPSPSLEPAGSEAIPVEAPLTAPVPQPRATADPVLFIQSKPMTHDPVTTTAVHEYAEASGEMMEQNQDESTSLKSETDDKDCKGNTNVNEKSDGVVHPPSATQNRSTDRQSSVRSVRAKLRSLAGADEQTVEESNAEPILTELQFKGTKFQQGYRSIQQPAQDDEIEDAIQQIGGSSKDIRSSQELPKVEVSKSPFTKIVAAMRFSTKKVTKRVKHAIGTKSPSRKKSPTLTVARTKSKQNPKPSLFSKARWKRKKKSDAKSPDKASTRATSDDSSESHSSAIEVERQYVPKVDMGPETVEESRSEASSGSESSCSSDSERLQRGTPNRLGSARIRNHSPLKQKKYQQPHANYRAADDWPSHPGQSFRNSRPDNAYGKNTRRGARRSLLQEFEESTPEKDVKRHVGQDHGGDSTSESGTSLESSWDNESAADSLPPVKTAPKILAEYSEIKPKLETKQVPPQVDKPAVSATGTSRQLYGTSSKIPTNRPVTARPRIEIDTWDTEDSSLVDAPPAQKLQLPRPGLFEVAKSATQQYSKNNPSSKPKVQSSNPKGSPLNNSWDSD